MARAKKKRQRIDKRAASVFRQPCAVPILELMGMSDFQENPAWIKKRLALRTSTKAIRAALGALQRRGLAKRGKDGRLRPVADDRATPKRAPSDVRKYHSALLKHAEHQLEDLPVEERHISSVTMRLSKRGYRALCTRIDALREEIMQEYGDDNRATDVYYVGFQIGPLTRRGKS